MGSALLRHSGMNVEPTVYAVDDDMFTRTLLEEIFQAAEVRVETYASAEEFLASYSPQNCGCVLLDMIMPGMDGLELQMQLSTRGNHTPVIFLSGADQISTAVKALKAGAVDFIEKPVEPAEVLRSVNKAMELDQQIRYRRLQDAEIEHRLTQLTRRETEVLKWIVRGKSNKLVARILDISTRTVEVHRRNVLSKMQAESVAELVQMVVNTEIFTESTPNT
ncbi:MAG: response regulator transcription factor [Halioglobus sp.]